MFSDHDETSPSIVAVSDIRNTIPSPADGGQIFSWCECAEKWKRLTDKVLMIGDCWPTLTLTFDLARPSQCH